MLLRNQLYAGIVDVAEYRVRGRRGDFEPLVSEGTFYRVQAVLSGRAPSLAPWCFTMLHVYYVQRQPWQHLSLRPRTSRSA